MTRSRSETGAVRPARGPLARLRTRIARAWRREDGVASLEFVLVIPLLIAIFMASFESGMVMVRYIMLEQAIDITMRNLRLGQYENPDHDLIKAEICKRTVVISDCAESLHVELQPISTTTFNFPTDKTGCVDRSHKVNPTVKFNPGSPQEVMLVRVCAVQDALFPKTGIGYLIPQDGSGGYGLVATSAFVNEP